MRLPQGGGGLGLPFFYGCMNYTAQIEEIVCNTCGNFGRKSRFTFREKEICTGCANAMRGGWGGHERHAIDADKNEITKVIRNNGHDT